MVVRPDLRLLLCHLCLRSASARLHFGEGRTDHEPHLSAMRFAGHLSTCCRAGNTHSLHADTGVHAASCQGHPARAGRALRCRACVTVAHLGSWRGGPGHGATSAEYVVASFSEAFIP